MGNELSPFPDKIYTWHHTFSLTIRGWACIILLTGQSQTDQSVKSMRRHGCAEAKQKGTREAEPAQ